MLSSRENAQLAATRFGVPAGDLRAGSPAASLGGLGAV
jgi:hypothetical protein